MRWKDSLVFLLPLIESILKNYELAIVLLMVPIVFKLYEIVSILKSK